jgi:hypothetical protein
MTGYYVLLPEVSENPEAEAVFVRDGFSWWGFILPPAWLLIRRLWLLAALVICCYILAGAAAQKWQLEPLPLAVWLISSLWVGLEGGHVRAQIMQKRGWTLAKVVSARNLEEAELFYYSEIYAERLPERAKSTALPDRAAGKPGVNTYALGLIDPYGGR